MVCFFQVAVFVERLDKIFAFVISYKLFASQVIQ